MALARAAFVIVGSAGALAVAGWLLEVDVLRRLFLPAAPMRANTALCFFLMGTAFYVQTRGQSQRARATALLLSLLCVVTAGLTMSQDLFAWSAGIDEALAQDDEAFASRPGRMSPATALSFLLLAGTCATLRRGGSRMARALPSIALMIAGTAVIGHLYEVRPLYALGAFTPLALTAALAFVLLSIGSLLAQPESEFLHVLLGAGPETKPARRLLAGLVTIPIVLGWLALRGHEMRLHSHELGVAIFAASTVFLLLALASFTVHAIARARRARERLERDLTQFEAQLQAGGRMRALAAALEDPIVIAEPSGSIVEWNDAATALFGIPEEEARRTNVANLVDDRASLEHALHDPPDAPRGRRSVQLHAMHRDGSTVPCELVTTTLRTDEGTFCVLVFRDITERYRAQQALARSEEKYRTVAVHAPVGIFEADAEGHCTFVNRRWMEITGLTLEEGLGRGWARVLHPEDAERVAQGWYQAATTGLPVSMDYRYISAKTGQIAWVEGSSIALRDESGNTIAYMGTLVDVTERRRALEALARSESNFRALVERAPFGVVVYRDGVIVYANTQYVSLFGYEEGELIGKPLVSTLIHPNDRTYSEERIRTHGASEQTRTTGVRCVRKNGDEVFVEGASSPILFDGQPSSVAVAIDVTERLRAEQVRLLAEQTLRESLREKEVLLKEIHHRVKNNLQVIVSLINLQASKLEDPHTRGVFDETRSRVHAIALLHERLYRSKNLGRIEMRDYLEGLVSDLASTNLDQRPIDLRVVADELFFEMDQAVPIGLIVNELVTNAYKHAFPKSLGRRGHVEAALVRDGDDILISVSDDGVGLPDNFDPDTSESLGVLLIASLSSQLEGEVTFERRSPGSRCVVRFRDPTGPESVAPPAVSRSA